MRVTWMVAALLTGSTAFADQTIHLRVNGTEPVRERAVTYRCDARGPQLGLPDAAFPVRYVTGAGNNLVIVRVSGKDLVFAQVLSADGARYASGPYTWWESHDGVSMQPQVQFASAMVTGAAAICREVKRAPAGQ